MRSKEQKRPSLNINPTEAMYPIKNSTEQKRPQASGVSQESVVQPWTSY